MPASQIRDKTLYLRPATVSSKWEWLTGFSAAFGSLSSNAWR
jgi:hypothetical protein